MIFDSMTPDDLVQFHNRARLHPVKTSRELFPQKFIGCVRATRDIAHYAMNKAVAMELRAAGDIETARSYEAICDRIYAGLPIAARIW